MRFYISSWCSKSHVAAPCVKTFNTTEIVATMVDINTGQQIAYSC